MARTHTLPQPPPVSKRSAGSKRGPPSAPEVYGMCVGEHAHGLLCLQPGRALRCCFSHCVVYLVRIRGRIALGLGLGS